MPAPTKASLRARAVPAVYRTATPREALVQSHALLSLPYPPSANRYWRFVGSRVLVSAEARAYKAKVGRACMAMHVGPIAGPLRASLRVYRPQKSGDLDNRVKVALDALRGYLFHDDSQVVELHAWRADNKAAPRIEVLIEPLP